jgi:hypothetical protein
MMLTLTLAALFGMKSLWTVNVALFCVLVMVQMPLPLGGVPVIEPVHVPVEL